MIQKHPIFPKRIRKIPKQFSWTDHHLVSDHYLKRISHQASALYLFLVTVSDAKGLSYYSDSTLIKRLRMDAETIRSSRNELICIGLIAWKKPVCQVLPIEKKIDIPVVKKKRVEISREKDARATEQLLSVRQLLKQIGKDAL